MICHSGNYCKMIQLLEMAGAACHFKLNYRIDKIIHYWIAYII
jgi:hypothetical protein